MNLAGALVAPVFYNLNVCDMKEKGRGQRICTPVSVNQWFHTFLASGKCPSCDKFGIVNNTSCLFSFKDESESTPSDNLDIQFGSENVSSCDSDSEEENENVTLQSQERSLTEHPLWHTLLHRVFQRFKVHFSQTSVLGLILHQCFSYFHIKSAMDEVNILEVRRN